MGLFTRLGLHYGRVLDANAYLAGGDISAGGLKSVGVGYDNISAQYNSSRQDLVDTLYTSRNAVRRALDSMKSDQRNFAVSVIQQMVNDDAKPPSLDLATVVAELIRQMVGSGTIANPDDDVKYNACSAGSVTAASSNTGDGKVTFSVKRTDGRTSEYVYPETLTAACTGDYQSGTATLAGEPFRVTGQAANATGVLGWDWATSPNGSGAAQAISCIDASLDNSGNLLTNSDFETFTVANTPDNWSILVGAAGTDIFKYSTPYKGSFALEFRGTGGSPLSSVAQTFNLAGGTLGTLLPSTVYAWNYWVKKSASLAAGVIKLDLVDSTNTVITDYAGNNNSATLAHGSITTSYAANSGYFVTPAVMPSTVKLRLSVSTALTSGESVYIDRLALGLPTLLYAGGPYAAAFSGATAFVRGDRFTAAMANDLGGKLQTMAWRFFGLPSLGLQLPSDSGGGQSIADTLAA